MHFYSLPVAYSRSLFDFIPQLCEIIGTPSRSDSWGLASLALQMDKAGIIVIITNAVANFQHLPTPWDFDPKRPPCPVLSVSPAAISRAALGAAPRRPKGNFPRDR